MSQSAKIAIVTGASRGAGRGIARALGSHGCTVYVTGRSVVDGDGEVSGTIGATAEEVTQSGGQGIPVRCDHGDDDQVRELIERVISEQGRIDILVNNACAISDALTLPGNFWEKPLSITEMVNVGIRSSLVASWYAAPHMIKQDRGLIVFTSSPGSAHYCYGPAYGAHKAALDKMAFDMGVDFADAGANVAAVSVWMGALATERVLAMIEAQPEQMAHLVGSLETPDYTGHVSWALLNDPDMMKFNGKTVIGAELGREYGITETDGGYPPSAHSGTGANPPVFAPYKVK